MVAGKLLAAWFPQRGRVMGIVAAGNNIGGLAMSQLATGMLVAYSWRISAVSFAVLMAVLGPLFWIVVRDQPTEARQLVLEQQASEAESAAAEAESESAATEDSSEAAVDVRKVVTADERLSGGVAGGSVAGSSAAAGSAIGEQQKQQGKQEEQKQEEEQQLREKQEQGQAKQEEEQDPGCSLLFSLTTMAVVMSFWTYPGMWHPHTL